MAPNPTNAYANWPSIPDEPYERIGTISIHDPTLSEFMWKHAIHDRKPHELIWNIANHGPKTYEFIR